MSTAKLLDLETLAILRWATEGGAPDGTADLRTFATRDLTRYIVARHHDFERKALPSITVHALDVARVHGRRRPALKRLAETLDELAGILVPHFVVEERIVFPALTAPIPDRAVIARELASMGSEHHVVGRLLDRIREDALDFDPPAWADASYRALCEELQLVTSNVTTHMYLEDRVLMPRFLH